MPIARDKFGMYHDPTTHMPAIVPSQLEGCLKVLPLEITGVYLLPTSFVSISDSIRH